MQAPISRVFPTPVARAKQNAGNSVSNSILSTPARSRAAWATVSSVAAAKSVNSAMLCRRASDSRCGSRSDIQRLICSGRLMAILFVLLESALGEQVARDSLHFHVVRDFQTRRTASGINEQRFFRPQCDGERVEVPLAQGFGGDVKEMVLAGEAVPLRFWEVTKVLDLANGAHEHGGVVPGVDDIDRSEEH